MKYCTRQPDLEKIRKSVEWRSKERGMLETELIFRSFNEKYLRLLTPSQLQLYDALLQHDEPNIWNWLSGRAAVPKEVDNEVFRMIKSHMNDFAKHTKKS